MPRILVQETKLQELAQAIRSEAPVDKINALLREIDDPQVGRYVAEYAAVTGRNDLRHLLEGKKTSDSKVDPVALASNGAINWETVPQIVEAAKAAVAADPKRAPHGSLLDELAQGPLGFFLLATRGMDGDHTDWIFSPNVRSLARFLFDENSFENFLMNGEVIFGPNRERFHIFDQALGETVQELRFLVRGPLRAASWPSGRMRDLLDTEALRETDERYALDLDEAVFPLVQELAAVRRMESSRVLTRKADALSGDGTEGLPPMHVMLSNGLYHYLNDDEAVSMIARMASLLVPGGFLITGHLASRQEWDMGLRDKDPAAWERARAFGYAVNPKYLSKLRTSKEVQSQLEKGGFSVRRIERGTYGIYPTFVAVKGRGSPLVIPGQAPLLSSSPSAEGKDGVIKAVLDSALASDDWRNSVAIARRLFRWADAREIAPWMPRIREKLEKGSAHEKEYALDLLTVVVERFPQEASFWFPLLIAKLEDRENLYYKYSLEKALAVVLKNRDKREIQAWVSSSLSRVKRGRSRGPMEDAADSLPLKDLKWRVRPIRAFERREIEAWIASMEPKLEGWLSGDHLEALALALPLVDLDRNQIEEWISAVKSWIPHPGINGEAWSALAALLQKLPREEARIWLPSIELYLLQPTQPSLRAFSVLLEKMDRDEIKSWFADFQRGREDSDFPVRKFAMSILATILRRLDQDAVGDWLPYIEEGLNDKDWMTQMAAGKALIAALEKLDGKETFVWLPHIEVMLQTNPHEDVLKALTVAVEKLDEDQIRALLPRIEVKLQSGAREDALKALAVVVEKLDEDQIRALLPRLKAVLGYDADFHSPGVFRKIDFTRQQGILGRIKAAEARLKAKDYSSLHKDLDLMTFGLKLEDQQISSTPAADELIKGKEPIPQNGKKLAPSLSPSRGGVEPADGSDAVSKEGHVLSLSPNRSGNPSASFSSFRFETALALRDAVRTRGFLDLTPGQKIVSFLRRHHRLDLVRQWQSIPLGRQKTLLPVMTRMVKGGSMSSVMRILEGEKNRGGLQTSWLVGSPASRSVTAMRVVR